MPRLVLFDLDDTLCDYAASRMERLRIAFTGPGGASQPPRDLVERMIADSIATQAHGIEHFPDLFARHGIGDPAAAPWAGRWYRDNPFHGLRLFPGADDIVRAVRGWGGERPTRIGIVTNGPAELQRAKIGLLGVDGLADFTLVSGEFGAWKPDRAIFEEALRLGGADADEALMVGDSLAHDIAGASDAGLRTVWVNRDGRERATGMPEPNHEIGDLGDLLRLPREWECGAPPVSGRQRGRAV